MGEARIGTGIFVRLLQDHETAVALDGPRDRWLTYNVVVDVRSAKGGGTFLSSPTLRKAIERWQPDQGRAIGRIVVRVQPANGATHLMMAHYFPLDDKAAERHLKGKGVASLVELAVERDLMKKFPRALISVDKSASWSRLWQLVARGRKPFLPIPIEEAYALTREYVLEERQRIRAERKMRPLRRRYEKGKRILKRAARLLRYGRVWAPK